MKNKKNFFELIFLAFLSVLYGFVISIRNFLYDNNIFKSKEFDLPIISIGNISVGGTGKTPHTEYLIDLLKNEFNVAILSRGYKRKTKGFRIVEQEDYYKKVGDEPLQIKQKFPEAIVAVCKQRVKGVEKISELYPSVNVIILDDAFQHRQINPGLSILLNNYYHPINEDYLLPLGRLREPKSSSYRAQIIIYTKCPPKLKPIDIRLLSKGIDVRPYQYLFFSTLKYHTLKSVFIGKKEILIDDLKNYNILIITGIANPENLIEFLKNKSKNIIHLKYPDHHDFTKKDMSTIIKSFSKISEEKIILLTEKDAIRLKNNDIIPEEIKKFIYCIPIEVELLNESESKKQFENQILNYVRNNKTYSKFYKNIHPR